MSESSKDLKELRLSADFMRRKLRESRLALKDEAIVIPYDNGGGQEGIRANPAFSEFEKLITTYQKTLQNIVQMSGDDKEAEVDDIGEILSARRADGKPGAVRKSLSVV